MKAKITNTVLQNKTIILNFFSDACLIGLKTDVLPYQLANLLNRTFYLNFFRYSNKSVLLNTFNNKTVWTESTAANNDQKNQNHTNIEIEKHIYFEVYKSNETQINLELFLYQNLRQNINLIPFKKPLDYLILIKGVNAEIYTTEMISIINKSTLNCLALPIKEKDILKLTPLFIEE